jgi:hypothetical protein
VGAVRRPEEQLQRAVVDLLTIYEARGLLTYCHVPNGGVRSKAEAGVLRATGVRAGLPDLLVWTRSSGFAIELKSGAGKLSPAQIAWHATVTSLGHRVYVCRSVDDVEQVLRAEGVPPVGKLVSEVDAKSRGDTGVQERAR